MSTSEKAARAADVLLDRFLPRKIRRRVRRKLHAAISQQLEAFYGYGRQDNDLYLKERASELIQEIGSCERAVIKLEHEDDCLIIRELELRGFTTYRYSRGEELFVEVSRRIRR